MGRGPLEKDPHNGHLASGLPVLLEIAKYSWAVLPPVRLWLRGGPPGVAIFVWDAVLAAPVPRLAGEDAESGRGLGIVAELSAACGFYHAADLGGKVTWAAITTP